MREVDYAEYIKHRHDVMFGVGSWDKLEADVRARHPELFEDIFIKEETCVK